MPRSRSRLDPVALMLGLVLTFTVTRALDSHAQAGLQALTVKAPFIVMDAEGTKPLLQLRDLGNGSVAFTIGGHTDSTGGVQLSVPASGNGTVTVFTKTGKLGAAMGVSGESNVVAVYGLEAQHSAASLSSGPSGGTATVYTNAGESAALIKATSTGAGRFEITRAGQIYVEAGVLPSGVGIVRTGPQIGGSSGGLEIPYAIMGKSGH